MARIAGYLTVQELTASARAYMSESATYRMLGLRQEADESLDCAEQLADRAEVVLGMLELCPN